MSEDWCLPGEVWKEIPIHGGHYEASSFGRIRSKPRVVEKRTKYGGMMTQKYKGRILRHFVGAYGRKVVRLGVGGQKFSEAAHRLVLYAFVGMPEAGMECCHNNGDAGDNRPENLRWDTHHANNQDRLKHGTYRRGKDHHMAKFSEDLIIGIKRGSVSRMDAEKMGIKYHHFWKIKTGEVWRHIN